MYEFASVVKMFVLFVVIYFAHLDSLLDFRGIGGCDSSLVVFHTVQYFGRLWVIVTTISFFA